MVQLNCPKAKDCELILFLRKTNFMNFIEILLKSGNDEMFYFIQSLLQSEPGRLFVRPIDV